MELNEITGAIVDGAVRVHTELGPGLFEQVYKKALAEELRARSLNVTEEFPIGISYRGVSMDCAYRIDLFVEDRVIVELKSVERVLKLHRAQLINYLKLADLQVGLLINFNTPLLSQGIHRIVNSYQGPRPSAHRPHPSTRS